VIQITPTYQSYEYLSGSTAISVIFNLPVIALGEEWTTDLPAPFILTDSLGRVNFIPGRFQWVTSSIVRFDPEGGWPSDLDLTLTMNPSLVTFDGNSLSSASLKQTRKYQTPSLSFYILDVSSVTASNLTGGAWNAWTRARDASGQWKTYQPEVPPDGVMKLSFNSEIEVSFLQKNLVATSSGASPLPLKFESCGSNCVLVSTLSPPSSNTNYWLLLPAHSIYGNFSGPSRSDIRVAFSGLYPFIFPYEDSLQASYLTWDLYLRHGLSQNLTNPIELFQQNIQIVPTVNFSVSIPDKARLRIQSFQFQPHTKYLIRIGHSSSAIFDGFGLKLLDHEFSLQTQNFTFYSEMAKNTQNNPKIIYFDSTKWNLSERQPTTSAVATTRSQILYSVLSQGDQTCPQSSDISQVYLTQVTRTNIVSVLSQCLSSIQTGSTNPSSNYNLLVHVPPSRTAKTTSFDISPLFDNRTTEYNGLVYVEEITFTPQIYYTNGCYRSKDSSFLNSAPFSTNFVSLGNYQILVSVIMLNTSRPVKNANVTILYFDPYTYQFEGSFSKITGDNGSVIISLPPSNHFYVASYPSLSCLVEYQNIIHFSAVPQSIQTVPPTIQSSVITDRGFYDVNDVVLIKGYLRSYDDNLALQVPGVQKVGMQIYWKDSPMVYYFNFDQQYGSFFGNVSIPSNSSFGNLYMSFFYVPTKGDPVWFDNHPLLISEPKIPSALLTFQTSSELLDPSSPTIPVQISVTTYTGIGIMGAKVNILWKLNRMKSTSQPAQMYGFNQFNQIAYSNQGAYPQQQQQQQQQQQFPDESGNIQLTIDDISGILETNLTFPFQNQSNDGDHLTLQITYLSPTNDLLSTSASLPVSSVDLQIILETSTDSQNIIPGYEFGVFVDTQRLPSLESVDDITVMIELRSWDGVEAITYDYDNSKIINMGSFPSLPQSQQCFILSNNGTIPLCKFNLPTWNNYTLMASATDSQGRNVFTILPIQSSVQRFEQVPLREFPKIIVRSDKTEYTIGDTVNLSFFNPYRLQNVSTITTSSVLVVYGNGYSSKSQIFSLSNMPTANKNDPKFLDLQTISFQIGEECRYFCNVLLIFNWGSFTFHENTTPNENSDGIIILNHDEPLTNIRLSPLFEWNQHHSMTTQFTFLVQDQESQFLSLSVSPKSTYVTPDSTTEITIKLNLVNQDPSMTSIPDTPTSGEVCVVVVDKSYLDLVPHPLIDLESEMSDISPSSYWFSISTGEQFGRGQVYNNSLNLYYQRLLENGWIQPNWVLYPLHSYGLFDVELTDQQFLARYLSFLTDFPPIYSPYSWNKGGGVDGFPGASAGAPSPSPPTSDGGHSSTGDNGADSAGSSSGNSQETTIRTNFIPTPLFIGRLAVNETGVTTVNLTVPDNLSTFSIYVYAVAPNHRFASAESSVISRETVNMQAISPNFVRIGDTFEIGVSLTSIPSFSGTVQVIVQTSCEKSLSKSKKNSKPIQLFTLNSSSNSQNVQLSDENNNAQILFTFHASRIGSSQFRFTLKLGDKVLDILQIPLEVQGQQDPIYLATSLTITMEEDQKRISHQENERGSQSGMQVWNEGIDIPEDETGSGRLDILMSVGKKAFIIQNSDYLLQMVNASEHHQVFSSFELLSSLPPVSLITTINSAAPSAAEDLEDLLISAKKTFQSSFSLLPSYTDSHFGLSYYPLDKYPLSYVDLSLNVYAVYLSSRSIFRSDIMASSLYSTWTQAISSGWSQLLNTYYQASPNTPIKLSSYDFDQLAFTYLAMGPSWIPPTDPSRSSPPVLSMSSLLAHYSQLSLSGKLALGLSFLLANQTNSILRNVTTDVENQIRIQGRTAYVSYGDSGNVDQMSTALSLEFLVRSPYTTTTHTGSSTTSILPYIAAFLAGESNTNSQDDYYSYYYNRPSLSTLVYSLYSLTTNDLKTSSFSPNLLLNVKSGSTSLMTASFSETNSNNIQTSSSNFTALEKDSNQMYRELQIYVGPANKKVEPKGQVTMTIGMEFIPIQPPNTKSFSHGITVQKIVQHYDPVTQTTVPGSIFDHTNSAGANVNLGDFVVVTIQITTTDELSNVRLVDLLPAAFQPLDTNIYSDLVPASFSSSSRGMSPGGAPVAPGSSGSSSLYCEWCYYCFSAFNYREYRSDQVVGYARHLYRGTYTFSYMAYVASSGLFYVPSTHVFAIEQPEVMGLSQSFSLQADSVKVEKPTQVKPSLCF